MVARPKLGDAYARRTNTSLKGGESVTVIEETTSQFNVTGDFFEEGTEVISDKMPKSFQFRGRHNGTVTVSVHFIKNGENRYVGTFVISKTHYVGEE